MMLTGVEKKPFSPPISDPTNQSNWLLNYKTFDSLI